jgi:hypothetical protein
LPRLERATSSGRPVGRPEFGQAVAAILGIARHAARPQLRYTCAQII